MKISYRRYGGILGSELRYEIDTTNRDQVSEETEGLLLRLIETSSFFELTNETSTIADKFVYSITIEHENRKHEVTFETETHGNNRALWELALEIEAVGARLDETIRNNIQKFLETSEGVMSVVKQEDSE